MNYKCSACGRAIGAMLDKKGKPELFKCPNTGRVAHTIPKEPQTRTPLALPKWLEPEDLSHLAKKRKKKKSLLALPELRY